MDTSHIHFFASKMAFSLEDTRDRGRLVFYVSIDDLGIWTFFRTGFAARITAGATQIEPFKLDGGIYDRMWKLSRMPRIESCVEMDVAEEDKQKILSIIIKDIL